MCFKLFYIVLRCSTLSLFVSGRLDGFRLFRCVLGCLGALGCILVAHVVKPDSDSIRFSRSDCFKMSFLLRSFKLVLAGFQLFLRLCHVVFGFFFF